MRSVVIAAWFSVAATGALASDVMPPAAAAETIRPVRIAVSAVADEAPPAREHLRSTGRAGADAGLPAQVRPATPPPGEPRPAASTGISPGPASAVDHDPVKLAVAPQQTLRPDLAAGPGAAPAPPPADKDERSGGSLVAGALLMMLVVMFRRRGAIR